MTLSAEAWRALEVGPVWRIRDRPAAEPASVAVSPPAPRQEETTATSPVDSPGWLMAWHGLLRERLGRPFGLSLEQASGQWQLTLRGLSSPESEEVFSVPGDSDLDRKRAANELFLSLSLRR